MSDTIRTAADVAFDQEFRESDRVLDGIHSSLRFLHKMPLSAVQKAVVASLLRTLDSYMTDVREHKPAKEVAPPDGFYRLEDGSVHDQPVYWKVNSRTGTPTMWGCSVYQGVPGYRTCGQSYAEWRAKNPGARLIPDYDRTGPAPATPPPANPASHSGYGHDAVPAYYTNNPDGKETIDRMFEEADRVCANFGTTPGYPTGEPLRLTSNMQRAIRAAICAAMALKYEDRAGRKGDSEGDKAKAAFYRQMQARWEQNNPDIDPRKKRKE